MSSTFLCPRIRSDKSIISRPSSSISKEPEPSLSYRRNRGGGTKARAVTGIPPEQVERLKDKGVERGEGEMHAELDCP
eukprot:scaffold35575_cov84-Isochrysis_galbana.AAC.1